MTDQLTTHQTIRFELLKLVPSITEISSTNELIDNTEQLVSYIYDGVQDTVNKSQDIELDIKCQNIEIPASRMGYGGSEVETSDIAPWNTNEFKAEYNTLQDKVTQLYLQGNKYISCYTEKGLTEHKQKSEEQKEQERKALYTSFASGREHAAQTCNGQIEGQYSIRSAEDKIRDEAFNLTESQMEKLKKTRREYFNRKQEFYKSDAGKAQEARYAADPLYSLYSQQLNEGNNTITNKISYFDQWSAERDAKILAEKTAKESEIGIPYTSPFQYSTTSMYITGHMNNSVYDELETKKDFTQTI